MKEEKTREPSSFKDPDGYVFYSDNKVYREVFESYNENYEKLMNSGLYGELTQKDLLIEHEEVKTQEENRVLKMDKVDFISYPYEWSFSQLKDAALLTLRIEKIAEKYDMTLKDASAYNIQFKNGKPVFIDTLSFEKQESKPWKPYRQFCRHFIAPLALMKHTDPRLNSLMRAHIDGIPLDLTSKLLPRRTYFSLHLGIHIHLHNFFQSRYSDGRKKGPKKMSTQMLSNIKKNLRSTVEKLEMDGNNTEWSNYYKKDSNYTQLGSEHKKEIVERYVEKIKPSETWDLGANNGRFSNILSKHTSGLTISLDSDPVSVNQNYNKSHDGVLPLVQDLANPSPDLGWMNRERKNLFERGDAELGVALALSHHLKLSDNITLSEQAEFFSKHFEKLIIEFVPPSDSNLQKLLSTRDNFEEYSQGVFEKEFKQFFEIVDKEKIKDSERRIYLMNKSEDKKNR